MVDPKNNFENGRFEDTIMHITYQLNSKYPSLPCYNLITDKYNQCVSSNILKPMHHTQRCMEVYEEDFKKCTVYYHEYLALLKSKRPL